MNDFKLTNQQLNYLLNLMDKQIYMCDLGRDTFDSIDYELTRRKERGDVPEGYELVDSSDIITLLIQTERMTQMELQAIPNKMLIALDSIQEQRGGYSGWKQQG